MIDLHMHLLPGIDDGAKDIYDTLEMARIAAENGTTDIVATPHCNVPGFYDNYYGKKYKEVFQKAREAIKKEQIPIRLHPGMEVFLTEEVPDLIAERKIITLNGSRYPLVEFDFRIDPDYADYLVDGVAKTGLTPLIAHVERYGFIQEHPAHVREWIKKGYVLQCNKGSFKGKFGKTAKHTAYYMLEHEYANVIASDAHSPYRRTPNMPEVYEDLMMEYSEDYLERLFQVNPMRICLNQAIIRK